MRFNLVDRILEVVPGQRIQALKNLTLGEEYLAEHFPTFPVMPGVLMLEALVQAGAWLLRITEGFSYSMVVLREAKGIKYGHFVEPGHQLRLKVELIEKDIQPDGCVSFKGSGEVDGASAVSGRLVLARYNLSDRNDALGAIDEQIRAYHRGLFLQLSASRQ